MKKRRMVVFMGELVVLMIQFDTRSSSIVSRPIVECGLVAQTGKLLSKVWKSSKRNLSVPLGHFKERVFREREIGVPLSKCPFWYFSRQGEKYSTN